MTEAEERRYHCPYSEAGMERMSKDVASGKGVAANYEQTFTEEEFQELVKGGASRQLVSMIKNIRGYFDKSRTQYIENSQVCIRELQGLLRGLDVQSPEAYAIREEIMRINDQLKLPHEIKRQSQQSLETKAEEASK